MLGGLLFAVLVWRELHLKGLECVYIQFSRLKWVVYISKVDGYISQRWDGLFIFPRRMCYIFQGLSGTPTFEKYIHIIEVFYRRCTLLRTKMNTLKYTGPIWMVKILPTFLIHLIISLIDKIHFTILGWVLLRAAISSFEYSAVKLSGCDESAIVSRLEIMSYIFQGWGGTTKFSNVI